MAHVSDYFAPHHDGARAKFHAAADRAGARLEEHRLPGFAGPDGGGLARDVALHVLDALRADHWIDRHRPDPATTAALRADIRAVFHDDAGDCHGMVVGQARTTVLQAGVGLAAWSRGVPAR